MPHQASAQLAVAREKVPVKQLLIGEVKRLVDGDRPEPVRPVRREPFLQPFELGSERLPALLRVGAGFVDRGDLRHGRRPARLREVRPNGVGAAEMEQRLFPVAARGARMAELVVNFGRIPARGQGLRQALDRLVERAEFLQNQANFHQNHANGKMRVRPSRAQLGSTAVAGERRIETPGIAVCAAQIEVRLRQAGIQLYGALQRDDCCRVVAFPGERRPEVKALLGGSRQLRPLSAEQPVEHCYFRILR